MRDYKNFDKEAFLNELAEFDVKKLSENLTGANSKYNILHDSIDYLLNKHAPLKKLSNKKMKQMRKPWISDIFKLIGQKNSLYSRHLQTGNHDILLQYPWETTSIIVFGEINTYTTRHTFHRVITILGNFGKV